MKILMVNKFFYLKGGAERYLFTLSDTLQSMGHQVIFFSMKDDKNLPCEQSQYFVSPVAMHGSLKSKYNMVLHIAYSKEAYKKMTQLLRDENPNLVILNNIHKQITCSIIDAIKDFDKDLPIYWICHDLITVCPSYTMLDGKGNICEKCIHGDFKNCYKNKCIHGSTLMSYLSYYEAKQIKKHEWYDKVDLFVCPSNFYKKKLEESGSFKSKIVWMRNPLSLDTKYELNDHDDGYILCFGRLSKEKGVRTLIDSMRDINYKLVILGTGPIEEELHEYVKSNNISNVEFKGFQQGETLTNYIRNARCVVLPSEWYENGPYSAMEAMALGKPLIVSDLGGLPELVEDTKNGYIYKKSEELKEKIQLMINLSKEEYSSICNESLNKAKDYFDAKKYVYQLLTEFNDCIN